MKREKLVEGIRFKKHTSRKHGIKFDRYFSIYFKLNGKLVEEGVGWETEKWTEEKVKILYNELKANRKAGIAPRTYAEKRELEQREREAAEKTAEAEKQRAEWESMTVSSLFKHYLSSDQGDKKPRSIGREKYLFRDYIEPVIGHLLVKDIQGNDIANIKTRASEKGLAAGSIALILAVTRQLMNYAIKEKYFTGINPTNEVKKPKVDNRRMRFLTQGEAEALLEALKVKSIDTYRITLFSLHMGLRVGEIFKLTWADVDQENGRIFIKDTKSKHNRFAYPTPQVVAEIEAMEKGKPNEALFPFKEDGNKDLRGISKTFFRVVKDLGLNDGIEDPRQKVVFTQCDILSHRGWSIRAYRFTPSRNCWATGR